MLLPLHLRAKKKNAQAFSLFQSACNKLYRFISGVKNEKASMYSQKLIARRNH